MPKVEEKIDIHFVDEQQFIEQIFFQYKDYVKQLARKKAGDPNDVEDIVQSTWELLLRNTDKLLAVSENKRMAYIATVVTNVIRMDARKKKLDTCSLDDVLEPGYDAMLVLDRMFDQKYVKDNFREAWAKVDPYVRELLERYYLLDQTHKEIAERCGTTKAYIDKILYEDRKKKAEEAEAPKRGRGRPKGSRNKQKLEDAKEELERL